MEDWMMDQTKAMALNAASVACAGRDVSPERVLEFAESFYGWLKK
jgi:hypothetical protein